MTPRRKSEERSDETIQRGSRRFWLTLAFFAALATTVHGFFLAASAPARAWEAADDRFPNSIMAPEPGTVAAHRAARSKRGARSHNFQNSGRPAAHEAIRQDTRQATRQSAPPRGSSGLVLPTPLPRTALMPLPHVSRPIFPSTPLAQSPSIVPTAPSLGPIPNLPHGPETFQDRASRCAFQQGLYNVPGGASSQYIGSCVQ
jgi:hypothetical protein